MNDQTKTPTACVVVIGNEILSGRTQDLNISFIGKKCDELGIKLIEARVIPDIEDAIIETITQCKSFFDFVFTTGGIGPTHDDITTECIAKVFGLEVRRNAEAVKAMKKYYEATKLNEARLKMADIPAGAILIDNPVSGAPGFQLKNVFVFPGIPKIMQAMFEGILDKLSGGKPIKSLSIVTGLAESMLAGGLGIIQEKYPMVNIGSYPFLRKSKYGVNIVIRCTDKKKLDLAGADIKKLIKELKGNIID